MKVFDGRRIAMVAAAVGTLLVAGPVLAQSSDVREGDEAFESGDVKKAAKKYDRAIRNDPRGTPPGVYGKRAAIYLIMKQPDKALSFIDNKCLATHPGAADCLEYKALALFQLDRREEAVVIAEKVVADKPEAFSNQLLIGDWYFNRDPDKAIRGYSGYLKYRDESLSGNDGMPRLKLGLSYLKVGDGFSEKGDKDAAAKGVHRGAGAVRARRQEVPQPQEPAWSTPTTACALHTPVRCSSTARSPSARRSSTTRATSTAPGRSTNNLGTSYLHANQPRRARESGLEYIRRRKGQFKGYKLVGDAYFEERNWAQALAYYQQAEEKDRNNPDLAMKMGETLLALDKPADAIEKLERVRAARPNDAELAVALGSAYLHDRVRKDDAALATVEPLLKKGKEPEDAKVHADLRYIVARAYYNKGDVGRSKVHFIEALKLQPGKAQYEQGLIRAINLQAMDEHNKGNLARAQRVLQEAFEVDKTDTLTNQNLAVVYLEKNECSDALTHIAAILKKRSDSLIGHRLAARAYLCQKKPDTKKAAEHYAAAEKRALKARNNKMRAEIYTEWAPLLVNSDLDDAIDKLEQAVQFAGRDPEVSDAANRNLALALYRRGWVHMKANKDKEAVEDFSRALRYPKLLKGTEQLAFEFSLALAYLDAGNPEEAAKIFKDLAKRGKEGSYLQAPYDTIGAEFFSAYADYRTSSVKARRDAATTFGALAGKSKDGKFKALIRSLVASSWELVAEAEYRSGNRGSASSALATAAKYATTPDAKERIEHNRAVLGKMSVPAFKKFGASPPEALVNLGIAYHEDGQPKDAYEAWTAAKARGARSPKLDEWIATKRKFFGYK